MPFWMRSTLRALLALSLLTFVSGCLRSDEPTTKPQPIPAMTPYAAQDCPDPGVAEDAIKALAENRLALADCRKRKKIAVAEYAAVRGAFGAQ